MRESRTILSASPTLAAACALHLVVVRDKGKRMSVITPRFHELTPAEGRVVLARNHVGRLAFLHGGVVDIQPVGYVLRGEWLVMRSGYGAKIAAIEHHPFVAFEVDEVRGPFEWTSVVVHGTVYEMEGKGSPVDREEFARSVDALREVMPAALSEDDPTPHRDIVYGLRIDRLTGRAATLSPNDRAEAPVVHARPPKPTDGF